MNREHSNLRLIKPLKPRPDYTVTFDLWETLLIDRHELDQKREQERCEGLHSELRNAGVNVQLDHVRKAYETTTSQLLRVWEQNGSIPTLDQVRLILDNIPARMPTEPASVERLKRAYVEPLFSLPPRLNPDAIQTLKGMRDRAVRLGLISNTGRSPGSALRTLMERYEILDYFDATIFSDEVGYRKPDRRIFEAALNQLKATPDHTIHIGDDPVADIRGAKAIGMRAVLFDRPVSEEFKEDPNSLFALTRAGNGTANPEVPADMNARSLRDALDFIDSLA